MKFDELADSILEETLGFNPPSKHGSSKFTAGAHTKNYGAPSKLVRTVGAPLGLKQGEQQEIDNMKQEEELQQAEDAEKDELAYAQAQQEVHDEVAKAAAAEKQIRALVDPAHPDYEMIVAKKLHNWKLLNGVA